MTRQMGRIPGSNVARDERVWTSVRSHPRKGTRGVRQHNRNVSRRVARFIEQNPQTTFTATEDEKMLLDGALTRGYYRGDISANDYNRAVGDLWEKERRQAAIKRMTGL
jgi:hypothetical protein